jgi:hypothetical protein
VTGAALLQVATANPVVAAMLARHPGVELAGECKPGEVLAWQGQTTRRRIVEPGAGAGLSGLVETMDNNPLVCAESFELPDAATTLALLAVAPAVRAGLVAGPVRFVFRPDLGGGGPGAAALGVEKFESRGEPGAEPPSVEAWFDMPGPSGPQDLDEALQEAYGRAVFVRIGGGDPSGRPWASVEGKVDGREACVVARADRRGKLGEAQAVHVFNVMAGFPESLGVMDPLPG